MIIITTVIFEDNIYCFEYSFEVSSSLFDFLSRIQIYVYLEIDIFNATAQFTGFKLMFVLFLAVSVIQGNFLHNINKLNKCIQLYEERNIAIFGYQCSTSLITLNVEFWKDVTYVRITNLFRSTPVQVSSFYRLLSLNFTFHCYSMTILLKEWLSIIINVFIALIFRRCTVIWHCATSVKFWETLMGNDSIFKSLTICSATESERK